MRDVVFDPIFRSTVAGDLKLIVDKTQITGDVAIAKRAS